MSAASSDVQATIERNPLVAVVLAMVAGVLLGMFSRTQK